ncbi:MAG: multi-sensor signal transduction multi-kinase [Gemmatimonadales bacterium]|nr:multi-sensor signal transduction multi-kinase [Gemmatimonadales bacterium]
MLLRFPFKKTAQKIALGARRCLIALLSRLGEHDTPDRLLIPEKLYGRESEIEALVAAFDRVVTGARPELVLVSGYSGIGKSSVVHELHKVLVPPRGLFASGKFDQYKRDIPYSTLAQAFQGLLRPLLSKSEAELSKWRDTLREALDPNGQLIVDLVPELNLIIGEQPPVPEVPPQDAQRRFQLVLRRLISVFARPEHPLALFLDDLQWLDAATLDLLEDLLTRTDVQHLLLVGAYRDHEVNPAHPLVRKLEAIRRAGGTVHEISLSPLSPGDLLRLVADSLHSEPEQAASLAQLIHEKTAGNPFFAIQFISTLADEGLLAFHHDKGRWSWDLGRIHAKDYSDNVADLMVGKFQRLSDRTLAALQQLACLGNVVEIEALRVVFGQSEEEIHDALLDVARTGLILRQEKSYAFLHDRIQEAAYALIPENQRVGEHLRIGRALLADLTANGIADHLFDVANQLNRGAALLIDRDEKVQVAAIDLRAGKKAKASAAFASARAYFSAGMALLDESDWSSQHELTFSLWLERAECEFLSGHLEKTEQLIAELLGRAASKVDQAAVYQLKVRLHTVKGDYLQATDNALKCLGLFGIDLPAHPSREEVQGEYETVWRNLEGRPVESLIDLPLMTDPELQAAVQLLSVLGPPAYFTDFHSFCLIACRMVKIGMQHGISDASTLGFALLGFISGPVFHRYHEGYRFAKLACDLVEKHGFVANQPKVYHATGTCAFWTQPIAIAIDFMRATTRTAIETGDLTFACYGMHQIVPGLLLRNDPLDAVWRESEMALDVAREAKYGDTADIIRSQQRFVATMQGRTASFSTFSDAQFDEETFETQLTGDRMPLMICFYWILKLKARFLSGNYAEALAAADKAKPLLLIASAQIELLDYFHYAALTVAALFETGSAVEQSAWRDLLATHGEQLREWADTYPPTFRDKYTLVSGEIARLEGRDVDAMRLYEEAIQSARAHGFVQNEGLAHEVAAQFYESRGFETFAHVYRRNARDCYRRWGAEGKVRQLEQLHPELRDVQMRAPAATTFDASFAQMDIGAVVKASQAISGEIVLSRLIEALMTLALEHAGAERGLLILLEGNQLQIEAEARTDCEAVEVKLRHDTVTRNELPETLLHTVIRTRENVILDDASTENPFSADEYFHQTRARSVLCLPLMKQATLIGVLYLENRLASRAFTPERISVLELLSSQAAISLENARLYAQLTNENRERRTTEEELRVSDERWRNLFENAPVGVSLTDSLGRFVAVNPAFERMVGYSEAELRGLTPLDITHEDDRAASMAFFVAYKARAPQPKRLEKRYRRKDGTVTWAELSGFRVPVPGGAPLGGGVAVDITDRKRAEETLRDVQAELARAARLTTMGELAASIAHEINQPLAAIVTHGSAGLRWLKRDTPELDEARDAFEQVVSNGQRAAEVIRGLRSLAKKSGPRITALDIDDTIREVLTLIHGEVQRHGVALRTDLAVGNQLVAGDRVQLQQVLLNLILNGVDAMKVVTDRVRELTVSSAITDETTVLISIGDTGPGLDPTIAHRLFEPLVTTKPDGLGMGLSICRSIIDAHGGHLWVSPVVPFGTLFRFTVPTGVA